MFVNSCINLFGNLCISSIFISHEWLTESKEINLITYVSFFHQKLVILSGPGALQFFFSRIVSQHISFVTLRSPSSTFGIICLNFSSISFNQGPSGFPESACSHRFRQKCSIFIYYYYYYYYHLLLLLSLILLLLLSLILLLITI